MTKKSIYSPCVGDVFTSKYNKKIKVEQIGIDEIYTGGVCKLKITYSIPYSKRPYDTNTVTEDNFYKMFEI